MAGDNGENVLTVFSAFKRIGTLSKAGLILTADLTFRSGVEVKKFKPVSRTTSSGSCPTTWTILNFERGRELTNSHQLAGSGTINKHPKHPKQC